MSSNSPRGKPPGAHTPSSSIWRSQNLDRQFSNDSGRQLSRFEKGQRPAIYQPGAQPQVRHICQCPSHKILSTPQKPQNPPNPHNPNHIFIFKPWHSSYGQTYIIELYTKFKPQPAIPHFPVRTAFKACRQGLALASDSRGCRKVWLSLFGVEWGFNPTDKLRGIKAALAPGLRSTPGHSAPRNC
jgi:hypothetical protein